MSGSPGPGAFRISYAIDGRPVNVVLDQDYVRLGRLPECDVVFPDSVPGMSRVHATITREPGGWWIEDAGSRNGTFVNKSPIKRHRLSHGDVINLGPLTLSFELLRPPATSGNRVVEVHQSGSVPSNRGRVEFNSTAPPPSVSVAINLADMSRQLAGDAGGVLHETIGGKLEELADRSAAESRLGDSAMTGGRAWGIKLFSDIGEALLSTTDLDQMLGALMDLVFRTVPSERGVFCLYNETADELVPKLFKSRDAGTPMSLRISESIPREAIASKSALLVNDATTDERFSEQASIKALNITSAICVPLYHEGRVNGLIYVDTQSRRAPFRSDHLQVLSAVGLFSAVAFEQARLRDEVVRQQKMREHLSRYHSPGVVEEILRRSEADGEALLADEKCVSVLFADLCGFTSLSERLSAAEVVLLLNQVFELLAEAVFEFDGSLDKFMGDGLLAFFGAPLEQSDHAQRAVAAALRMQKKLGEFNQGRSPGEQIAMRIGINSGAVIVGDIGSLSRKDYTVIGDTVNIASRLESQVAQPGQVVIGPATYDLVHQQFECSDLPVQRLKGKGSTLRPFLVSGTALNDDAGRSTHYIVTPPA